MQSILKFTSWNSRGMSAAIPQLRDLLKYNDFICVCEHWLHENRLNSLGEIDDDFLYIARSSKYSKSQDYGIGRGQGGVALFWRKNLPAVTPFNDLCHDRICGVRFEPKQNCVFNILSVYLPDVSSSDKITETIDELSAIIENFEPGSQTIICGDFNGDVGQNFGGRGNITANKHGSYVCKFLKKYNLVPTNTLSKTEGPIHTFNGHNSTSTLDYICIPKNLVPCVYSTKVISEGNLNTSDHNIVEMYIDLGNICRTTFEVAKSGQIMWNKVDPDSMNTLYTDPVSRDLNVVLMKIENEVMNNEMINDLFKMVITSMIEHDKNLPRRLMRKHYKPYWNEELSNLKKDKVLTFRIWKSQGRPRDPTDISYINYKSSKKIFIKRLRALHRMYENDEISKIVKSSEIDRKYFWRSLRKVRTSNMASVLSIKNSSDKVIHDIDGVLDVWEQYFDCLSTPKHSDNYDNQHYRRVNDFVEKRSQERDIDQFTREAISYDEIKKAITKLHNAKAPGYDLITTEHIKNAGNILIQV